MSTEECIAGLKSFSIGLICGVTLGKSCQAKQTRQISEGGDPTSGLVHAPPSEHLREPPHMEAGTPTGFLGAAKPGYITTKRKSGGIHKVSSLHP